MLKTFDTLDLVPETLRASAIESKDGKFIVDDGSETTLKEAGKKALDTERAAREEAEKTLKSLQAELVELKRKSEAKAVGVSEEMLQKLREDELKAREPLLAELAAAKAKLEELNTRIRALTLTDRVQKLALDAGIMPDRIEDAMLTLSRRTDLTDAGGIAVLDKEGKLTTESIQDFLAKTFKAEKPWYYKGTASRGSNAEGSQPGGDPAPVAQPSADIKAKKVVEVRSAF